MPLPAPSVLIAFLRSPRRPGAGARPKRLGPPRFRRPACLQDNSAGDRIADFSSAGYEGGGVALPEVPGCHRLSGSGDDTAPHPSRHRFRRAVAAGRRLRGRTVARSRNLPLSGTPGRAAAVLRGSGAGGSSGTTIAMSGGRHAAIAIGGAGRAAEGESDTGNQSQELSESKRRSSTPIRVPSGAASFSVADARRLRSGMRFRSCGQ